MTWNKKIIYHIILLDLIIIFDKTHIQIVRLHFTEWSFFKCVKNILPHLNMSILFALLKIENINYYYLNNKWYANWHTFEDPGL